MRKITHKTKRRLRAFSKCRTGKRGEELAARYLLKRGYFIWQRNWRNRSGEIDIIAYSERKLRIIEVKTRKQQHQSDYPAIMAIDDAKINRLEKLTNSFVRKNSKQIRIRGLNSVSLEAITVLLPKNWLKSAQIIYYQNLSEDFNYREIVNKN